MPPVGALIAGAAAAVGSAVTAVSGFFAGLGAIGTAVGNLALSLGLSYIASLLFRPDQPKPSDGQVEVKQAVPSRFWHYGRVKVSGPLAFYESRNGALYKLVMLSTRPVDAIEHVFMNDVAVGIRSDGAVVSGSPTVGGSGEFYAYINQSTGAADQGPSGLLRFNFPDAWTADHRLQGTAYIVGQFIAPAIEYFQSAYPNGEPSLAATLRGVQVYDPRNGTTYWSDNAALAVLDYLTHPDGYDRPMSRINLQSFIDYAWLCDDMVNGQRRYRIATTVDLTESRKDVLQRLLEACDASLYMSPNGQVSISGGRWEEPTVVIDADLGHIITADFSPPGAMDRYNELVIQYREPSLGHVENEATPWEDPLDIAQSGQVISQNINLFQVPSQSQARRLAKIRMARDNADWTAEIVTNLAGLNCIGERIIRLRWPELSIDAPFWVEGVEMSPDITTVSLKLRSASQASYAWSPDEEGSSTVIPPDTSPSYDLTPPDFILAQTDTPSIVATWTPSQALNRAYNFQYRNVENPDGWQGMTTAPTRDRATAVPVTVGRTYAVRGQTIAGPQAVGPWSAQRFITILEPEEEDA